MFRLSLSRSLYGLLRLAIRLFCFRLVLRIIYFTESENVRARIAGLPGRNGVNGHNGLPGRNGGDGAKGEKGKAGPRGPRGFKGQAGEKGVAGTRGPRGIKGEAGLVGKVAAEQRNWKQCAWQKNDGRDIGLIK